MTNEELVEQIQTGDRSLLLELWGQVSGLVCKRATYTLSAVRALGHSAVDHDDLMQAGFVAMVDAVERFNPDLGYKFSTLFVMCLKTAFSEATGCRSEKNKRDPIHTAGSLDRPLDEEDGDTLRELIPDPRNPYKAVDERLYREWLHDFLADELAQLPAEQESVIRHRYYHCHTSEQTGELIGADRNTAQKLERKALDGLRRSRNISRLHNYLEGKTDYFHRVPARSGRSPVEEIVTKREAWAEGWTARKGLYYPHE